MFQYALGRSLSILHEVPLQLDTTAFQHYTLHAYRLNRLRIRAQFANQEVVARIQNVGIFGKLLHRLLAAVGFSPKWVKEKDLRFDARIFGIEPPLYLEGYWQSEKYFSQHRTTLCEEFTLAEPMEGINRDMAARMAECDSVAVHIRRGDYVSNAETNRVHGVCGPDYYQRACQEISTRVPRPQAFVFSDDLEWAKESLGLPFPTTFVDVNDETKNYLDLHLMAACKHQIIANSSFSWWAAWLNPNKTKVVVAPRRWFRQSDFNNRDIVPDRWIKA